MNSSRTILRRAAAGATLAVAPMLIALGAATVCHADTGITHPTTTTATSAHTPWHPVRNQDIARSQLPYTSASHHHNRNYQY